VNPAEDLLAMHLAELGLHFVRQYRYAPPRKFKADFAVWDGPDWSRLADDRLCLIEVTGGIYSKQAHGSITGILKDNERLLEAFKAGWAMIRVTPDQVMTGEAKRLIEAALKR
jgi:hypothetical protein